MKFIKKNDIILIAVLIVAAVLMLMYKSGGFAVPGIGQSGSTETSADGESAGTCTADSTGSSTGTGSDGTFSGNAGSGDKNSGKTVIITVDDSTVYSKSADEISFPETVDIEGYDGGHNIFVIDENADGLLEIYCSEADCPDKICVETGHISILDQPVVCLPHRITARISKSS